MEAHSIPNELDPIKSRPASAGRLSQIIQINFAM